MKLFYFLRVSDTLLLLFNVIFVSTLTVSQQAVFLLCLLFNIDCRVNSVFLAPNKNVYGQYAEMTLRHPQDCICFFIYLTTFSSISYIMPMQLCVLLLSENINTVPDCILLTKIHPI